MYDHALTHALSLTDSPKTESLRQLMWNHLIENKVHCTHIAREKFTERDTDLRPNQKQERKHGQTLFKEQEEERKYF